VILFLQPSSDTDTCKQYTSPTIYVPARTKYVEPIRNVCEGCGVSVKVSKSDQLMAGQQTQYEYSIANNQLYYDLSYVDCAQGESAENCPGHDRGNSIDSPDETCRDLYCGAGSYCPNEAYFVDQPLIKLGIPEPVFGCGAGDFGMDLWFNVCHENPNLKRSVAGRLAVEDSA
jgi:hypothetical protein